MNDTTGSNYRVIVVKMGLSHNKALQRLVIEVNDAISLGWKPTGGITLQGTQYLQAMVRVR